MADMDINWKHSMKRQNLHDSVNDKKGSIKLWLGPATSIQMMCALNKNGLAPDIDGTHDIPRVDIDPDELTQIW